MHPDILLIQQTLKELLKEKGVSLKELAEGLGISLPTAKRLLNRNDISLGTVLQICEYLGISLENFFYRVTNQKGDYYFLDEQKEAFLAEHSMHLKLLSHLQKDGCIDSFISKTGTSELTLQALLRDLENEGFLQREGNERISLSVPDGMDWRIGGPLWEQQLDSKIRKSFDSVFEKCRTEEGILDLSIRPLSRKAASRLKSDLHELSRRYAFLSRLERRNSKREDVEEFTCLIVGSF